MKTSEKGKHLIKTYEGCRLSAYKPVLTEVYYTIGYGHYGADVKQGMKITQAKADELLTKDLEKFEKGVSSCVKVPLNQSQFDALVSFAYNCGIGALQSSTLLKKLNAKDYNGAANEFLKWDKANGKPLAGLTKRRKAERELFLSKEGSEKLDESNKLPYDVITTTTLNIRPVATTLSKVIRTVDKGTKLTVWAEITKDGVKWGKNGNEYFCLKYCERV